MWVSEWVEAAQSCLTLSNPIDCTVHGILQARYWSGEPCPSPVDLPNPGMELRSPALQVDLYHLSRRGSPGQGEPAGTARTSPPSCLPPSPPCPCPCPHHHRRQPGLLCQGSFSPAGLTPGGVCVSMPPPRFVPPSPPRLCPQVRAPRLRLQSFPANRLIRTTFLDSVHRYINMHVYFSFSDLLHSV